MLVDASRSFAPEEPAEESSSFFDPTSNDPASRATSSSSSPSSAASSSSSAPPHSSSSAPSGYFHSIPMSRLLITTPCPPWLALSLHSGCSALSALRI